jgi:hypothetical protein
LVNTIGKHYVATYTISNGEKVPGQWLKTKLTWLLLISAGTVTSGTLGVYQYIKNNAPQAVKIDIDRSLSPTEQKIAGEKSKIADLDKRISALQSTKTKELADYRSYSVWQGKEYLLPEVKTRHLGYDKQLEQMNVQRATHQKLIVTYEERLQTQQSGLEKRNDKIQFENDYRKEQYAGIVGGIWLGFEALLVFILAYSWIFKYHIKQEDLLNGVSLNTNRNTKRDDSTPIVPYKTMKSGQFPSISENSNTSVPKAEIGFDKWYEKKTVETQPQIEYREVVKEVPVEVQVEVPIYVETLKVMKEVETEGFPIICEQCGKSEVMRSPKAKFCSNKCRKEHWKIEHQNL